MFRIYRTILALVLVISWPVHAKIGHSANSGLVIDPPVAIGAKVGPQSASYGPVIDPFSGKIGPVINPVSVGLAAPAATELSNPQ